MRLRLRYLLSLSVLLIAASVGAAQSPPTVLLISIDGFRWDYVDRIATPNLHLLMREGVRAELVPSFPTKTFPNHYTLVTGLRPGHHGIVANQMWDDEIGTAFTMDDRQQVTNARWWQGEPIWVTAERAGLKTAPYYWPGSEAPIEGIRPSYWEKFDKDTTSAEKLHRIFGWLDMPLTERPSFLTLYFPDVDDAGHHFGPASPEVEVAVANVDAAIGRLITGLKERRIYDHVNMIVVSDHGMADAPPVKKIFLEDYVPLDSVRVIDWSPVLAISSLSGDHESLYRRLRAVPHLRVYRKRETPVAWAYREHSRIAPVIAVADEGWRISTRASKKPAKPEFGNHGYTPDTRSMHGIFIAHGPAFQPGIKLGELDNVDVYPAMCRILCLTPNKNDSKKEGLKRVMRPTDQRVNCAGGVGPGMR